MSYSPTYNISFVTVGHGLNYKCTASNDAGESIPVTVMVQVLSKFIKLLKILLYVLLMKPILQTKYVDLFICFLFLRFKTL